MNQHQRPPLTVLNAEIKTAAVEIRTLSVSGKQVTLAVFRQLKEEELVNRDGSLNGVPWGVVNYHPDKCGNDDDYDPHIHVVWQRGKELLRSFVWLPDAGSNKYHNAAKSYGFHSNFSSDHGTAALNFFIYIALKTGRQPFEKEKLISDGSRIRVTKTLGPERLRFDATQVAGRGGGQALWLARRDQTQPLDNNYERLFSDSKLDLPQHVYIGPYSKLPGESDQDLEKRQIETNKDRICGDVFKRVMEKLAALYADAKSSQAIYEKELIDEVAAREGYLKAVDALGCLPQLFIAV
jgi:hypothetical protein